MTPITNISMVSSTNSVMTTSQPALTYTHSGILHKQQSQTDLSMNKLPSSTLVDLLKQRRSPPPSRLSMTNNSLSTTTRQRKQNSTGRQPKRPTKKSQIQTKRLAIENDNNIRVNLNLLKLFYLKIIFRLILFRISQIQM